MAIIFKWKASQSRLVKVVIKCLIKFKEKKKAKKKLIAISCNYFNIFL